MQIEFATLADVSAMQAIELDAVRAYLTLPEFAFCASLPARDDHEHRRCLDRGASLVCRRNGVIAGFLLILPVDGAAHVLEAGVRLDHQRQGIGVALFGEAERCAAGLGFDEMTLTTYRDVVWNAPFYRRLGYVVFEPGRDRPGLLEIIDEERRSGFAVQARVAMRKKLRDVA